MRNKGGGAIRAKLGKVGKVGKWANSALILGKFKTYIPLNGRLPK
jgi:hypothetical protein